MSEEEIRSRILLCEIKQREFLEVGNTKTANRYSNEISKWEDLLEKLNPKRDIELKDYKNGYQRLQQENKELKDNWNKLKEYSEQEIENNKYCYLGTNPIDKCRLEISNDYLDKIKELEGGK